MKITEKELAAALASMVIPADTPSGMTAIMPPQAGEWASSLFQIVRDLRAEDARWVPGAVYESVITAIDGTEIRTLHRREPGGWYSFDCREHFRDGSLDTTGWVRLVPESGAS